VDTDWTKWRTKHFKHILTRMITGCTIFKLHVVLPIDEYYSIILVSIVIPENKGGQHMILSILTIITNFEFGFEFVII